MRVFRYQLKNWKIISAVSHSLEEESVEQANRFSQKMQLQIVDAKNSQKIQNTQIDEFIRQSYDVIAVNIVDRTVASSLIDKVKQADIPIIFFNSEPILTDLSSGVKRIILGVKPKKPARCKIKSSGNPFKRSQPRLITNKMEKANM